MTYRLQVKDHIDAAHFLKGYEGKCNRMHGHRWEVEVCLESERLDHINMMIDFSTVKMSMKKVIDHLDHYILNERLDESSVTAEYLSKWFFEAFLDEFLPGGEIMNPSKRGVKLVRVTVWESPECCVKYSPTMHATGGVI